MNWGKWIIVAFVLFAAFIATLVTVCMRQEISLVSKDYYAEELDYQEQIHRMNNVNDLSDKPTIQLSGNSLAIDFHHAGQIENGMLKLFNPSDPHKDKSFQLNTAGSAQQFIPLDKVSKGMYRARMQWASDGKEYFIETIINI